MQTIEEDDFTPRRTSIIRSEIRGYQRNLSEAAERGDHQDYAQALANLDAAKRELADAEVRERQDAIAEADRRRFKKETGYSSPGEMIATEVQNGTWHRKAQLAAADRAQKIAEALLKPAPTPADLAAEALQRITANTTAVKQGAISEIEAIANGTDFGDAA